jgi:hypothetical protein
MIRVGMKGDDYVLFLLGPQWGKPLSIPLTLAQAADLHAQLCAVLPDAVANVEPFSADDLSDLAGIRGAYELAEKTHQEEACTAIKPCGHCPLCQIAGSTQ